MASLMWRSVSQISRRTLLVSASRTMSGGGHPIDPMKGKVGDDNAKMPDLLGHSVGRQRFEMMTELAGVDDPFEMIIKRRAKGTKDEPTVIASSDDHRLVGCICEDESLAINWLRLNRGEPKRCDCGYWFQLAEVNPDEYPH